MSAQVAFKKADADNNGVVTVAELKSALQIFLQGEEIKPAEFKMILMALDTNRNGRVEQQEFIQVMDDVRRRNKPTITAGVRERP